MNVKAYRNARRTYQLSPPIACVKLDNKRIVAEMLPDGDVGVRIYRIRRKDDTGETTKTIMRKRTVQTTMRLSVEAALMLADSISQMILIAQQNKEVKL